MTILTNTNSPKFRQFITDLPAGKAVAERMIAADLTSIDGRVTVNEAAILALQGSFLGEVANAAAMVALDLVASVIEDGAWVTLGDTGVSYRYNVGGTGSEDPPYSYDGTNGVWYESQGMTKYVHDPVADVDAARAIAGVDLVNGMFVLIKDCDSVGTPGFYRYVTPDVTAEALPFIIAVTAGVRLRDIVSEGSLGIVAGRMAAVGGVDELLYTAAADRVVAKSGLTKTATPQMAAVGGVGHFVSTAAADRALGDSGVAVAAVSDFLADPNIQAADVDACVADGADGESYVPFMLCVDCTALAVDGIGVLPRAGTLIDAYAISNGANGAAQTVTVRTAAAGAGVALTTALPIVADNDLSRTTTMDYANSDFAVGASVYCNKTADANDCTVYLLFQPIP